MERILKGVAYIIAAIYGGIFTFNNRNNMPSLLYKLYKVNFEVIDKKKFNKIMVIQYGLMCVLFLLSGVLRIISKISSAALIPAFFIFIHIICSKIAKKYITIK